MGPVGEGVAVSTPNAAVSAPTPAVSTPTPAVSSPTPAVSIGFVIKNLPSPKDQTIALLKMEIDAVHDRHLLLRWHWTMCWLWYVMDDVDVC